MEGTPRISASGWPQLISGQPTMEARQITITSTDRTTHSTSSPSLSSSCLISLLSPSAVVVFAAFFAVFAFLVGVSPSRAAATPRLRPDFEVSSPSALLVCLSQYLIFRGGSERAIRVLHHLLQPLHTILNGAGCVHLPIFGEGFRNTITINANVLSADDREKQLAIGGGY